MTIECGFFNSVNNDRLYNAEQISTMFEGLIGNGVFNSVGNRLVVQRAGGMNVSVRSGRGYFNGHWLKNTSDLVIQLNPADVTLNRYVAIVVKVDDSASGRTITIEPKYGTLATKPIKPTMTRSTEINEYCLAYIYVKAKATSIEIGDITDTRSDSSVCGWVTGLIEQLDTSDLYDQWTASLNNYVQTCEGDLTQFKAQATESFNEWFSGLVDIIDDDVETTLVNAMPKSAQVNIRPTDWTQPAPTVYRATMTVSGMTADKQVVAIPTASTKSDYLKYRVKCISVSPNSITFESIVGIPERELDVKLLYLG